MQKSFFRVGRQTAAAVVIALVAALLSAVVSSPAQAVDNRRAVTALLRLSSGTVTDGYVTVYKEAADPLDGYQYYTDDYASGTVDVDLEPGKYKFEFYSFQARASKWYAVSPAAGTDEATATPVTVTTADKFLGQITFPVRNVTVTVKDGGNLGVAGMHVHVASDPTDLEFGDYDYSGSTNASGIVVFRNLPTTESLYFQSYDESGWDDQPRRYDDSNVGTVGETTASGTVALTQLKRASIAGKVTNTASVGLSLVDVNVYDVTTGNKVGGTVTDSQGNYLVPGLDAGDYRLEFVDELSEYTSEFYDNVAPNLSNTATPVSVGANATVTGKNAVLAAEPVTTPTGVDLTGVVRGTGNTPLSNVEVIAYRNGVYKGSDVTGRDGRYTFDYLTSGSYKVQYRRLSGPSDELPYVSQWSGNSPSSAGATPISVTADSPGADKSISLPQYGWITGQITGADNLPISEGWVDVVDLDGNFIDSNTSSSAAGYQVLVPPGVYNLRFTGYDSKSDTSYVPEWYDNKPTMVGAKTVTVGSAGTTAGINAKLTTQLEALSAPKISGSPILGRTLTASTGTWNQMAANEYKVTWLRGATVVGTGTSYVVKSGDVGQKLSVRVDAVHNNLTGQAFSAATATVKRPSTTTLTATSPKSKTVKLVVKVLGTGLTNPGGKVTIKRGTTTVKTGVAVVNGKAVITLTGQPKGFRTYRAYYGGTSVVLASTSAKAPVTVKP